MDFKGIIIIFLALFCVIISQGHGIVFFDDFNDNIFDSTSWAVWLGGEATGELEESDSVLQLRLPPECLGRMCLVSAQTKRVFSGDFDVQVDYDIVVCSPSDHVACFLRILPECLLSPTVAIYWSHSWYSDTDYVAAYAMIGDSVWRPVDWDETLDSEGSFRITRSGDTFGFYYGSLSGWVPITTYTLPMGQVRVALQIQHEDIWLADYEVHFDNFYVQADSIGYIGCTPPEVSRLCLNEFIEIMISEDDDSVYPPSIDISVNGINYDISSPQLIYTRGTEILTFFSVPPWDEGDSNEVCVNHVENYMGDAFLDTVCWSFVVDTTPPVMVEYFPPADTMTFDVRTPIWVHLEDLYHPILNGTLQLNVNGFNYGVMHPFIDWDSTTITFDISGSAFEFPRAESVEVCINYADNITFCPSNEGSFCWRFFVGDSIPPEFDIIEPLNGYVTACDDQQIFIRMTDNIAFDCSTVILEINGIQYSYPDGMDYSDSLLSFTAPLNWADYETVDVCITEGRDIFGISFRDLPFCWSFIVDLSGPFYRDFSPGAGETIQLAQPVISVYIEDYYTEVRTEDMLVFIDIQGGDSFTLDTSQFSWNDTLLIVSTESNGIRFSGGEEITVCIHAYDTPDYCSSNLGDTCWTFFIVSGGPRAEALLPLNNEITACSDQAIFISLLDSNGVQESTILLTVEGESFRTTSDELTYINDTLIFTPPYSGYFSDHQVVEVSLIEVQDSLNNAFVGPLSYSFIVDLSNPSLTMTIPEEGDIIRDYNPDLTMHFRDVISGMDPDSILIDAGGYIFSSANTGFTWSPDIDQLGGYVTLSLRTANVSFVPGDTVLVQIIRACDKPDYCRPNCLRQEWSFIIEHDYDCDARPNPFTPNGDRFNPVTYFSYQGMDLDKGELAIYDLQGNQVYSRILPPKSEQTGLSQSWDGTDNLGNPLKQGTYLFIIKVGEQIECNGTVTLVR